jgi:hypothetical protein
LPFSSAVGVEVLAGGVGRPGRWVVELNNIRETCEKPLVEELNVCGGLKYTAAVELAGEDWPIFRLVA